MKRIPFILFAIVALMLLSACATQGTAGKATNGGDGNWAYITGSILLGCMLGLICAYTAWKKGYTEVGFFFFGLFLFIPAIITIACLPLKSAPVFLAPQAATAPAQGYPGMQPTQPPPYAPPPPVQPYSAQDTQPAPPAAQGQPFQAAQGADALETELDRITQLRDRGFISEEEYQVLRRKALGL
jgi:hypothetical protein